MYTILNGLSPYIMQEISQTKSYYYNNRVIVMHQQFPLETLK